MSDGEVFARAYVALLLCMPIVGAVVGWRLVRNNPPQYMSPWFGALLGFLLGGGIAALALTVALALVQALRFILS